MKKSNYERGSSMDLKWIFILLLGGIALMAAVFRLLRKPSDPPIRDRIDKDTDEASKKEKLMANLIEAEEKRLKMESYEPYAKLFSQIAPAIQLLLGLDTDLSAYESDYLAGLLRRVEREVTQAISQTKAEFTERGISVLETRVPDLSAFKAEAATWDTQDMIAGTKRRLAECKQSAIWVTEKNIVLAIGGLLYEICEIIKSTSDMTGINDKTKEIRSALEQNGIYPLFEKDFGEASPMRDLFISIGPDGLKYPGLFIKYKGQYEQLGKYKGTR